MIMIIIIIILIIPWLFGCCIASVLRFSLSFFVVLPSFPSFLQVGLLCSLFCWVVLLCLFILWMVFLGGTTFPLSSIGWCRLASFVGCCCVLSSPFAWCCLASHPFGGAAFSPSAVWVLLCLLLLWAVLRFSSPFAWCCLPSLPLGGAAFSSSSAARCCLTFSFFGWCFGRGYFSLLFCWVVPLGLLHLYFSLLFCWVVPLGLPLWVVLRLALSPFAWCCLRSHPFGGAAFSLLFSWVVLPYLLFLWVVLRYSLSFCVVVPSFPTFFGRVSFKKKSKKKKKRS